MKRTLREQSLKTRSERSAAAIYRYRNLTNDKDSTSIFFALHNAVMAGWRMAQRDLKKGAPVVTTLKKNKKN
jgi:hypothetical protein